MSRDTRTLPVMVEQLDPRAQRVHVRPHQTNKVHHGSQRAITVRKVPADSVPYGSSISTHGNYVWAAYADDGELIAIAPTAAEARGKYRDVLLQRGVRAATPDEG